MSKPSANQRYTGARKLAGLRPGAQFGLAISLDEILGRSNGWISLITAQQDRSRPVTLVDLRDQSFSGTSAAFSFDSTGAGASSAGAAAGLGDAGASSAGALSVKASIKVVFLAFDFRVGRRHADFHLRPLRKTLPMGPR